MSLVKFISDFIGINKKNEDNLEVIEHLNINTVILMFLSLMIFRFKEQKTQQDSFILLIPL